MQRTITINGRAGLFDTPSFLLTENEDLTVKVEIKNEIKVGKYYLFAVHGTAPKKAFLLSDNKAVTLPAEWIKQGGETPIEFSLELRNAKGTSVIRSDYEIEPLAVTTLGGDWRATAIIQCLESRISALEEALKQETKARDELAEKFGKYVDEGIEVLPEELQ